MVGPSNHLKFNGSRASSFTSFGFFAAASILLMIVDHQMRVMEPVRNGFAAVSNAVYSTVTAPARGVEYLASHLQSKSSLVSENERLKDEIEATNLIKFKLNTLSEENAALKQLLEQKEKIPEKMELFNVRRVLSDGFTQRYQIDGGFSDGLAVGMPVLTEQGLAGQLIHVARNASQVQLIQDKNQEIPVLFEGSNVRGIVHGTGYTKTLESRDLPYTDKIKAGDRVVTSGLDGIYPKGILVGTVRSVTPGEAGSYVNVTIDAPQSIGTNDRVMVLLVNTKVEMPDLEDTGEEKDPLQRRRPKR